MVDKEELKTAVRTKREISEETFQILHTLQATGCPPQIGMLLLILFTDFVGWMFSEEKEAASLAINKVIKQAKAESKRDTFTDGDEQEDKPIDRLPDINNKGTNRTQ